MSEAHDIQWRLRAFDDLSLAELYSILAARAAVFVVEQRCNYQDMDGVDGQCWHLMGWDGEKLAAYSRIVPPGARYAEPSIGRVLTSAEHRGTGLGRELMRRGLQHVEELYPGHPTRIGAQAHLQRFYGEFGFVTDSDIYFEDHIEHVKMLRLKGSDEVMR